MLIRFECRLSHNQALRYAIGIVRKNHTTDRYDRTVSLWYFHDLIIKTIWYEGGYFKNLVLSVHIFYFFIAAVCAQSEHTEHNRV